MEEQVRQRPMEKSINHRRIRQSTINSHRQSSTIANRFTYLLSAATTPTSNMADNIKRYSTINNYRQLTTIYPKSSDRKNSRKRKRTRIAGPTLSGNNAVADAVSQQCLSTGAIGQYRYRATTSVSRRSASLSVDSRNAIRYTAVLMLPKTARQLFL